VHVRARLGRVQQEQALAEADLHLDRVVVAEDGAPVHRRRWVRGVEQVGLQRLERQTAGLAHAHPPSLRVSGTPRMSAWKTIVPPTNPCTLKTDCRRFSFSTLLTSTRRSPGRTRPRKRTFSRPPKPT